MKLTKFVHSCLLVETPKRVAIFDPGEFSWESGLFDLAKLARLDDIIITHEHADHCSLPFLRALVARFPAVRITTTPTVVAQLTAVGFGNVTAAASPGVELFTAPHEHTEPLGPTPQNIGVHYAGLLTHPGDCLNFSASKAILALPITAPWGAMTHAVAAALALSPRYVIPIHDWHWNRLARQQAYDRCEEFFAQHDITFIKPTDGVPIEL